MPFPILYGLHRKAEPAMLYFFGGKIALTLKSDGWQGALSKNRTTFWHSDFSFRLMYARVLLMTSLIIHDLGLLE